MEKVKLLYDASMIHRIAEGSKHRSGIFFVAYNVLLELIQKENIDLKLYCDLENKFLLENAIKNHSGLKECDIIRYSKYDEIIYKFEKLKYENKKYKKSKINRAFIKIILKILHTFAEKENINTDIFQEFDAFLSPKDAVPKFLKDIESLHKYIILHDIIPLRCDGYKLDNTSWFVKLMKSLNSKDTYFANSEFTKQDILDYFDFLKPEQMKVIPLSSGNNYAHVNNIEIINNIKNKYNIPKNKNFVFSLCALEPRKNIPFAVKNFIEFIKKHKIDDCVFVLGGDHKGQLYPILEKEIPDYNEYKDRILCTGYIADEDLSALYSSAEMFIFPSLYEGFGIPVLEAMQCRCAVITSNVSSLPEVIGDTGIQVNPKSDKEMLSAIEKLYFDKEYKNSCIEKGFERAKLFSWKNCADIICETIISGVKNEQKTEHNYANL